MISTKLIPQKQTALLCFQFNYPEALQLQAKAPLSKKSIARYFTSDQFFQNILPFKPVQVSERANALLSKISKVLSCQLHGIQHRKEEIFHKNINLFWSGI